MRRSCYYMGRYYSQRHLNAVNSPLCKGYISPTHFSMTVAGMATFPLQCSDSLLNTVSKLLVDGDALSSNALLLTHQRLALLGGIIVNPTWIYRVQEGGDELVCYTG
eukprot:Tbor_TRINITY_DN4658_c0_g1::TRINITY_DN4658_c0_g1_i1::g.14986::m.14986